MAKMKRGPKLAMFAIAGLLLVVTLHTAMSNGWIATPGFIAPLVPKKAALKDLQDTASENVTKVALPSTSCASSNATPIRLAVWAWNAQANLLFANGGTCTTKGSLMEKYGANVDIHRQDDTTQMQNELVACAKEIHDGSASCSNGANGVIIMGDGAGQFLAGLNPQLAKLGPGYQAAIIGSTGWSRGEDAFMAPPVIRSNAQNFKKAPMPGSHDDAGNEVTGLLIAGVERDGDWDIGLNWAGINNIHNNPNDAFFDPDALNWVNADDYLKAVEKYNSSACEDRKIIKAGKPTGKVWHVCVNAVVTWTPGDVNTAKGRGGLAKIASSKQFRSQMPAVIIGPKKFFQTNAQETAGMLAATFAAGDQLKAFDEALHKAAAISARVYNDQDEKYWYKYFKGTTERDSTGLNVELGGSAVNNLNDELVAFGIQGGTDYIRATYNTFGAIVTEQYPSLFAKTPIPDAKTVIDKSFVIQAQQILSDNTGGAAETANYSQNNGQVVGDAHYNIEFDTGKATIKPAGVALLQKLKDNLSTNDALKIGIDGYTDDVGNAQSNVGLSLARAESVHNWLSRNGGGAFPAARFDHVEGHGAENPIGDNNTAAGKAANRRVDIILTQ